MPQIRRTILAAAAIAVAFSSGAAHAQSLKDAEIVAIYAQVNGFDIETALLGQSRGASAKVRDLAHHVAADHLVVRQGVHSLAQECGVQPLLPAARDPAAAEHDDAMIALSGKSGPDFDRAFLSHEAAFHRSAIDAVKTLLLPQTTCPQLQAYLREFLPAFEQHLAETEKLARELGAL